MQLSILFVFLCFGWWLWVGASCKVSDCRGGVSCLFLSFVFQATLKHQVKLYANEKAVLVDKATVLSETFDELVRVPFLASPLFHTHVHVLVCAFGLIACVCVFFSCGRCFQIQRMRWANGF